MAIKKKRKLKKMIRKRQNHEINMIREFMKDNKEIVKPIDQTIINQVNFYKI